MKRGLKLIACIDDSFGMSFNGRRVSQDSVVLNLIRKIAKSNRIWMNSYSAKLFLSMEPKGLDRPDSVHVWVSDKPEESAGINDFCFIENRDISNRVSQDTVQKIILFRWNRRYPSDIKLSVNLEDGWEKTLSKDFVGSSHEKITLEVWNAHR